MHSYEAIDVIWFVVKDVSGPTSLACVKRALLTNVHLSSIKKCIAAKGPLQNVSEMFSNKVHNFLVFFL